MLSRETSVVRGLPSLDDDLHRLRPDGYQSGDIEGVRHSPQKGAGLASRNLALTVPVAESESPSLFGVDDGLSRHLSATSMASAAPPVRPTRFKRRVQIQGGSDDEGADDGNDAAGIRLPGQPLSFTGPHANHPHKPNTFSPSGSAAPIWMSQARLNPLMALPEPDGLPDLHRAAWANDLDDVLELLKTQPEVLDNLIWVNPKLYPKHPGAGLAPSAGSGGVRSGPALAPLPQNACMVTATAVLKSLLQRHYLYHACHPLTIAAAHGNERMVDELLKAMMEAAQAAPTAFAMTWRSPPEELPPGCPWVTPLGAAALGGNGECVRLLSLAIARRKSLMEDRSTYGCFRFRPLVVAQTSDAVGSLFKYGCCRPDTLRYNLCDAARRIAKLDCGCVVRAAAQAKQQQLLAPPLTSMGSADDDANSRDSPPDSPRNASLAASFAGATGGPDTDADAPPKRAQRDSSNSFLMPSASLEPEGASKSASAIPPSTAGKAAELKLFRARLFHDFTGRPLAKALCEFQADSLTAVAALAAMVDQGLQPDRFLSHAEHPSITSTSLLMVVVRNYRTALQSASGGALPQAGTGTGPGGILASMPPSPGLNDPAATTRSTASVSLGSGVGAWAHSGPSDMFSAAHEALNVLVAGLLAHGAVVDEPPREGCRQVGGFHVAAPHGPEAPLHHAFIHGPQELVVLLLQYSSLQPEVHEELLGGGAGALAGSSGVEDHTTAALAFYSREPERTPSKLQSTVPWAGGRSSPLLAFGAKVQSALAEGNLPLWLHSGRFSELMEDLIKCTIAADAYKVTQDLTWLVLELFERGMAHEFDHLPHVRRDHSEREVAAVETNTDPHPNAIEATNLESLNSSSRSSNAGHGNAIGALSGQSARTAPEDTVITVGAAAAASTSRKAGGMSAAEGRTAGMPAPSYTSGSGRPSTAFESPSDSHGSHGKIGQQHHHDQDDMDDGASCSSQSDNDMSYEIPRRKESLQHPLLSAPEDSISLSIIHSLYRHTADAITGLHQALNDGSLDGPLASMTAPGGTSTAGTARVTIANNAPLVDWTALLRLVARIAATTLNPPRSHGVGAAQISVFTTAKAVNQLLYARDWARDGGEGGLPSSVIDIDLLRAIARRHPHEAARLIHGMDLMRVELKCYRWDSIPMSLDQDFYAVLSTGEAIKLSNRAPTVAPVSVAAAAAEQQRQAAIQAGRLVPRGSAVYPINSTVSGLPPALMPVLGGGAGRGEGPAEDPLTREDILQACVFSNMWTVLMHFLLSSTRLPAYMRSLQTLRNMTYKYAVLGQVLQYGSIPVVIGLVAILTLVGLMARGLQRSVTLLGNLVLALYDRLEERLQPAMSHVGRKLQLDRVQRKVGRMVRRVDRLAHRATGGNVIQGSTALNTVRFIPHYLSFLRVLLDPDALAELWLGVTQHYRRGQAKMGSGKGEAGGTSYLSGRTTRVVCNRVPLACAAAMPSSLLYKLAASPQVNGELFASPVMRAVITWRWQHYTRYFLLLQFVEHLIYMGLFMLYAFSLSYDPHIFITVLGTSRTVVVAYDGCSLPPTGLQKFLLISIGVLTLTCVVQEVRQLLFFKLGWLRQPWNLMDFASSTIVGTIITLHLNCNTDAEWLRGLAAIEVALLFMRLLYFAMADDRLGSFFRMVIEVLRDCWLFFVFLGILFIGWGLALTVMQGQSTTIQDTYLQLFTMIFGDFQMDLLQSADAGSTGLNHLWRIFASVYQILVTIILLNLLIAIINDSYERINDNEACESLRNKLTLIVEAESVMPPGMARRMLEALAQTDLYVITAEAATVASNVDEGGTGRDGMTRRPLPPPSRWSGRMGETKRFVGSVVDQLTSQQAHFQSRVLSMLSSIMAHKGGADVLPPGAVGMPGAGRDVPGLTAGRNGRPTSQRFSGVGASGLGAGGMGAAGMRGPGGMAGPAAPGGMTDLDDAEAFGQVLDLGKLLKEKLLELQQQHEETKRQHGEDMEALTVKLQEGMQRVGREVARSAAESAAAATIAASAGRLVMGEAMGKGGAGSPTLRSSRSALEHSGSRSSGNGNGAAGCGDVVLVERSALEMIAQKAAEQAAMLAVQGVLRELGQGRRG